MTDIEGLIGLSEQMLECLRVGEWAQISDLDMQRRKRLEKLFSGAYRTELGQSLEPMRRLIDLDAQLLAAAQTERNQRADRVYKVQKQKRRNRAYQCHGK